MGGQRLQRWVAEGRLRTAISRSYTGRLALEAIAPGHDVACRSFGLLHPVEVSSVKKLSWGFVVIGLGRKRGRIYPSGGKREMGWWLLASYAIHRGYIGSNGGRG